VTSRRQFIQSGLAVSAASLTLPPALNAAADSGSGIDSRAELLVYDDRFAEAVGAGRIARARGLRAESTADFFENLWYDEFDLRWKQAPMTLAGITTAHGLFVVETLALDRGMRVEIRESGPAEGLVSWVIGPRERNNSA
jgi:hypothetical protein